MELVMTDYQFKKLLQMILEIMEGSGDLEEAKEKVEKLLSEE